MRPTLLFCLITAVCSMLGACSDAWRYTSSLTPEQQALVDSGWVESRPVAGDMPEHYGIRPKRSLSRNTLVINLEPGMGAMLIKVMSAEDSTCLRYVCAEAGTITTINDMRAGTYYLLMAYGRDFMERPKGHDEPTEGRFTRDAHYERSAIDFTFSNNTDTTQHEIVVRTHGEERRYNFAVGTIDEATFLQAR